MDLSVRVSLPRSPVPSGVLDEAETLTEALQELAARFPDYECLRVVDRQRIEHTLSLGTLWTRVLQVQATLIKRGLRSGGFVVIILPTSTELVAAYFGVMLAGGIPALVATPSNRLADRRIYASRVAAILDNAQAQFLYAHTEVAPIFQEHADKLPVATAMLTPAEVCDNGAPPARGTRGEHIATVQYSSGSTGAPKGVLLTHSAILNNLRALRAGLKLSSVDVSVNWIPLYHDMGLIDGFLLPLLSGCPTVLIPTMDFMREPALWLWAIHHYRGAHAWAPNFAYAVCADRIDDRDVIGLDLSSWRLAVSAAEPVLAHTVRAFIERFSPYGFKARAFTPVYGLAENVTAATAHPSAESPRVEWLDRKVLANQDVAQPTNHGGLASVATGRALPECTIEIRDVDRRRLPERHVGAIWLRSSYLFSGYHRNAAATDGALVDGWLNTSDRGYLADGYLYFVARDSDVINVGGEKYPPHDIETVINAVPGVREGCAAALGILNEERGTEDIAAVVETKLTDEKELHQLRDAIRNAVTAATGLALRYVILVPPGGVEKTTSGKLARNATRRRYASQCVG